MEESAPLPSISPTRATVRLLTEVLENAKYFKRPYEVEFRFRSTADESLIIDRQDLYNLIAYYSARKQEYRQSFEKTRVTSSGDERRQIEFLSDVRPDIFQKKQIALDATGTRLQDEVGVSDGKYSLKFSVATEEPIGSIGDAVSIRERSRVTFANINGRHQIDLSIIDDGKGNKSYEVEVELLSVQTIESALLPIKHILRVLNNFKDGGGMISRDESVRAIEYFNDSMVPAVRRIKRTEFDKRSMPQPINLKRPYLSSLQGYSVTDKLNGIRYALVFSDIGTYLINPRKVVKIGPHFPPLEGTIIDVEYFRGVSHAFDIMWYRDSEFRPARDVRPLILTDRLKLLDLVTKRKPDWLKYTVKKFHVSTNLSQAIGEIMIEIVNKEDPDANDGLIFTPIYEPYSKDLTIYKWKPEHQLTIDLRLSPSGEGKYDLMTYTEDDRGKPKYVQFKDAVFYTDQKFEKDAIGEFAFSKDDNKWVLKGIRADKILPNYQSVAEDVWEDIQMPIQLEELLEAAATLVADDSSLRRYNNSIKRDLITTYCSAQEEDEYSTRKTVLDIGIGNGGDLSKYQKADVRHLYGVDPEQKNLDELKRRLAGIDLRKLSNLRTVLRKTDYKSVLGDIELDDDVVLTAAIRSVDADRILGLISSKTLFKSSLQSFSKRITLLNVDGGNTHRIVSVVGNNINIVASFFSLTFFFDTALHLQQLIDTIDQTTVEGSYFIGTTMDGEQTLKFIEAKRAEMGQRLNYLPGNDNLKIIIGYGRNMDGSIFNQILQPIYTEAKLDYGKQVLIDMGVDRIVHEQTEYLVMFDQLIKGLAKKGFQLVHTSFFDPPDTFSPEESAFIRLNRKFVFQKVKPKYHVDPSQIKMIPKVKEITSAEIEDIHKQESKTIILEVSNVVGHPTKFDSVFGNFVRMATPVEGSSFIQSIMLASSPAKYLSFTPEERKKGERDIQANLMKLIDHTVWNAMGGGDVARRSFLPAFFIKLREVVKREGNLLDDKNIDIIQENFIKRSSSWSVAEMANKLHDIILDYYKRSSGITVQNQNELADVIKRVYSLTFHQEYNKFKQKLSTSLEWIDNSLLEAIGKVLERDIYILNNNGKVYTTGGCRHITGTRKGLILVWVNSIRYEPVSLITEEGKGKSLFDPKSPQDAAGLKILQQMREAMGCNERPPDSVVVNFPMPSVVEEKVIVPKTRRICMENIGSTVKVWLRDPSHVYVGSDRPARLVEWKGVPASIFANPYKVTSEKGPRAVLEEYKRYILNKYSVEFLQRELKGKVLGCLCKSTEPCHADVLVELVEGGGE
jgi:hypothetical protein